MWAQQLTKPAEFILTIVSLQKKISKEVVIKPSGPTDFRKKILQLAPYGNLKNKSAPPFLMC